MGPSASISTSPRSAIHIPRDWVYRVSVAYGLESWVYIVTGLQGLGLRVCIVTGFRVWGFRLKGFLGLEG